MTVLNSPGKAHTGGVCARCGKRILTADDCGYSEGPDAGWVCVSCWKAELEQLKQAKRPKKRWKERLEYPKEREPSRTRPRKSSEQ